MRILRGLVALVLLGAAPGVSVVVNDRPLHVAAIARDGRVLVPMRAIFESLGAGVVYKAGHVTAKRGDHRVEFTIGQSDVSVDGQSRHLDVPAEVRGATTYVPLRFVSTALGASVDYDNTDRIVTVDLRDESPSQSTNVTAVRPMATIAPGELLPAPHARAASAYPSVGAQLSGVQDVRNVRMTIDGEDVTPLLSVSGGSFLYIPQLGLPVGTHTVSVTGYAGSTPFAQTWSFDTTLPPASQDAYTGPNYTGVYSGYQAISPQQQLQLYVDGNNFGPGSWINIHLTAQPNGRAYAFACTGSWSYGMYSAPNSPFYNTSIQIPDNLTVPRCPIVAEFVDQFGNITYAPYPVFVSIFSPQATAVPQPTATPAPTARPIPHPTDPHAGPLPTSHPMPTPTARAPFRGVPPALPLPSATPFTLPHVTHTAQPQLQPRVVPTRSPVPRKTEPPL